MDRCALFVDAGYVFAGGGRLCFGTTARSRLVLDAAAFNELLVKRTQPHCDGLPVLRTYWYDGAKNGIPSTEQRAVAALPNVKLRLGRVNARGEQKGVDALIYRDLLTLATERAVTDAFLVSGDEDLREGVKAAQDRGVRVTLVGVPAVRGFNQSRELVEEADAVVVLDRSDVAGVLLRRPETPSSESHAVASKNDSSLSVTDAARMFAAEWLRAATPADADALRAVAPRIPRHLDVELLQFAESYLHRSLRGDDAAHRVVRAAFWAFICSSDSA